MAEPAAHTDGSVWPDLADPAVEHPMAYRHFQIRDYYDSLIASGKPAPQMKTAS
jgi:transaldolase